MVLGVPSRSFSPPPLADAGSAGVGEDGGVDGLEGCHLSVALNGRADLLGAGGDHEGRRRCDIVLAGLVGDVGGAAHVLVGGVGAAADEGGVDGVDKAVGTVGDLGGEHGYGAGPVGRVGPDYVGLEGREVDLDEPVEVGRGIVDDLSIRGHEGRVGVGEVGEIAPVRWRGGIAPCARRMGIRRWSRRAPRPCW